MLPPFCLWNFELFTHYRSNKKPVKSKLDSILFCICILSFKRNVETIVLPRGPRLYQSFENLLNCFLRTSGRLTSAVAKFALYVQQCAPWTEGCYKQNPSSKQFTEVLFQQCGFLVECGCAASRLKT